MNKKLYFLMIHIIFFTSLLCKNEVFANDFGYILNNPTLINCESGDDTSALPFNSNQAYSTVKKGIEDTVAFINQNGLTQITGNGGLFIGQEFEIDVMSNCFVNGIDGNSINLDFSPDNLSSLIIKGIGGNFTIDNVYFNLTRPTVGNITFRNVNFWRNDLVGVYFNGFIAGLDSYNGPGIKIFNSLINISSSKQIMSYNDSRIRSRRGGYGYNIRNGGYDIQNSLINISLNADYVFRVPYYMKNNKVVFKNSLSTPGIYNVHFYPAGNNRDGYNYGSITMLSNEIHLGGNNFYTPNENVTYINNNFLNANNFMLGTDESTLKYNTFLNNQITCTNQPNITTNESVFNNVFFNGFTDTRDIDNFKRNFNGNTQEKGIGWLLRKRVSSDIVLSTDYRVFYKDITGNDLPNTANNPLYITVH